MKTLLAALLLLHFAGPASALRCNGRLAEVGDHALQIREVCGDPFWVDQYQEVRIAGEGGLREQRIESVVEVWYFNFGADRLMQRVSLRDDRMLGEETLGYGFDRAPRGCNPDRLPIGLSSGEIIARCGGPLRRSERYADLLERDGRGFAQARIQRREDWVYGSGSARNQRVLVLIDSRLVQIQRLSR